MFDGGMDCFTFGQNDDLIRVTDQKPMSSLRRTTQYPRLVRLLVDSAPIDFLGGMTPVVEDVEKETEDPL